MTSTAHSTHLPALAEPHQRDEVGRQLQATLVELVDLSLLGKQLHWNVVVRELTGRLAEVAERARERMDRLGELDAASQDVVIEVVRALEKQLWMIRAQFPDASQH
jgi:DNA-binding ferritin-like protein